MAPRQTAAPAAAARSKAKTSSITIAEHSDNECVVCMEGRIEVMLLPCKCYKLCLKCSEDIKVKKLDCPWCRSKVDRHMRVRR